MREVATAAATALVKYQMYIVGQWVDAASGEFFESDNPYTGQPWALIPRGGPDDVDRAVQSAHAAFTSGEWPRLLNCRTSVRSRPPGKATPCDVVPPPSAVCE